MSTTVNIHAAKTRLSQLVERAARGEEIIIARAGRPLARLGPLSVKRRRPGLLKGKIRLSAKFNAPLPEAILKAFEGR